MDKDIKKKIEFHGLVISRLPSWARDYIKSRAKEEFADDFGQAICYFIKMCLEYEALKEKFIRGDLNVQLSNSPQEEKEESRIPRSISGEEIKYIGGKK